MIFIVFCIIFVISLYYCTQMPSKWHNYTTAWHKTIYSLMEERSICSTLFCWRWWFSCWKKWEVRKNTRTTKTYVQMEAKNTEVLITVKKTMKWNNKDQNLKNTICQDIKDAKEAQRSETALQDWELAHSNEWWRLIFLVWQTTAQPEMGRVIAMKV